uniref:Uncharacterized protein n=1 Tax=Rhizophora mucronata TaxID=61149 RepID=A0A2P2MDY6_RHIMU
MTILYMSMYPRSCIIEFHLCLWWNPQHFLTNSSIIVYSI